ncbi:unnamed protein product, partial [Ectocarpus sp. 8 AP-2014]
QAKQGHTPRWVHDDDIRQGAGREQLLWLLALLAGASVEWRRRACPRDGQSISSRTHHIFTTRRRAKRRGNSLAPPRLLIQQQRWLHRLLRLRHLDISPPPAPTNRGRLLLPSETSPHSLRIGEVAHPPPLQPAAMGPGSGAGLACDAR